MNNRMVDKREMPDVAKLDFVGSLAELWAQISYAAYHLAYVRVYSQSEALRTEMSVLWTQEQSIRENGQVDITICRTHLASLFWHLEHVFEALRTAVLRGQKEYPADKYFWTQEKLLEEVERSTIRQEIRSYRNMGHQTPAIIGARWDNDHNFVHHFLPTICGHACQEDIEMNTRLQQYFEFVANAWLSFAPGDFKTKFPRDFRFPVTVPYLFAGELPPELKGAGQLEVRIESCDSGQPL